MNAGRREEGDTASNAFYAALRKSGAAFVATLPIILGMVLLTGLLVRLIPTQRLSEWFGHHLLIDALIGAAAGGIAIGHPLASYVLGGELLKQGVSLVAITAFLVSWVTVGSIQLPAEALLLGKRFALLRNLINFLLSIVIGLAIWATFKLAGLA